MFTSRDPLCFCFTQILTSNDFKDSDPLPSEIRGDLQVKANMLHMEFNGAAR